ncbi:MAG: hypothetical protein ACE5DN_06300 [Flavobacteriales bacterium]
MARRNYNTFIKKQKEEKKRKKKLLKMKKKEERKNQAGGKSTLDDMMAYVDKDGNITSEPPVEAAPKQAKEKEDDSPAADE